MPTKKICTDVVTLFNYVGEVDFVAEYDATIMHGVNVHFSRATNPPGQHSNRATLCIFDQTLVANAPDGTPKSFIENDKWKSLPADTRKSFWTIDSKHAGKDFFVMGEHLSDVLPNADRFRVEAGERFDRGTVRVRHWKVVGV